jgi:hypothetical protein
MYRPSSNSSPKIIDVILCRLRQRLVRGGIKLDILAYWGSGVCLEDPIRVIPAPPTHEVIKHSEAIA